MKIKMVDIARHLGVSKATVSLAVNGKPGVNEETRRMVLECLEEMKKNNGVIPVKENIVTVSGHPVNQMIKIGSLITAKVLRVIQKQISGQMYLLHLILKQEDLDIFME